MRTVPMGHQPSRLTQVFTRWIVGMCVAAMLALLAFSAHAAPPPAGSTISNTASASYIDGSATSRTVTSNPVNTTVLQVAALTLTANGAQSANAGTVVNYPHTLTNTGNGSDTFNLTAVNTAGVALSNIQIFLDNGSGLPTGPAITNTGALAANATFKFIVQGTVPAGAANAATSTITVTATSTTDNTKTASNTDTTTVTTNAVVTLTKAISASSGAPGTGPYTYTLTYTNTGNSTATAVTIADNIPAGMAYVPGSARWSVTGATPLSDTGTTVGTPPNTVTSNYTGTTFTAAINQVTQGQSGVITFSVTVPAGTTPGVKNNTATLSYNNGAGTATGTSGTVGFTVTSTASLTFTPPAAPTPTAAAGSTVSFTNVLTNTGTATDSFNLTFGANNFPPGTTFQLFAPDGFTPITNTGPVAPGATYNVIVKAILPANATGTGPFNVANIATSVADPTKSATATDTLTALTTARVDATLNAPAGSAGALGTGAGPEAAPVQINATNPGTSTRFTLVANNTGSLADSYNLDANAASNFGTALPAGWVVTYTAGACPATGTVTGATVTNTGSVAAGGNASVCASVAVPAGYAAGTQDVYFRLLSTASGATDIVHAAVSVNAVRSLVITNPGTGQTFPGGQVIYTHVITNTGNVNEGNGTLSTIALSTSNSQPGFTSTLFYDAGSINGTGDGVLTAGDPAFTGNFNTIAGLAAGLAPGQSITIFDKVISPSGAVAGTVNTTTISVAVTNGTYTTTAPTVVPVQDNTSIIVGNLTLTKAQALDASCTGPIAGQTYSPTALTARPGQCVLYQITVTNVGAANATSVVVNDSTPTFTTLSTAPAVTSAAGTGTVATGAPAVGGTGVISINAGSGTTNVPNSGGTLVPSASTVFTFGVKVNQ